MPKVFKWTTALSLAVTIITAILFRRSASGIYFSMAVTAGVTFYHLAIRLSVGMIYNSVMKNHADYTGMWYQIRPWEGRLYRLLNVKKWKNKMPVYDPELFSTGKHTWEEIAQAMCQSELVHETNAVLSFLPIAAFCRFGVFPVFLITSLCAAAFDLSFAVIQRYNRARIMKILEKKR